MKFHGKKKGCLKHYGSWTWSTFFFHLYLFLSRSQPWTYYQCCAILLFSLKPLVLILTFCIIWRFFMCSFWDSFFRFLNISNLVLTHFFKFKNVKIKFKIRGQFDVHITHFLMHWWCKVWQCYKGFHKLKQRKANWSSH
jgi:hypothetical protein